MSATIYQFPAGGRPGLGQPVRDGKPDESAPRAVTPSVSPAITACGAAWYHEEAMKEDERTRKS